MELKDILSLAFKLNNGEPLGPKELKNILPELQNTKAFKDANIKIVESPMFQKFNEKSQKIKTFICQTHKALTNTEFNGDVYLYSIELSPKIYTVPKLNGNIEKSFMTNIVYNPETFIPYRFIVLKIDPSNTETHRECLHDELDYMLDNPEKCEVGSTHIIYIRGMFNASVIKGEPYYINL